MRGGHILYGHSKGGPRISSKNQLTVPVAVLDEAGLRSGDLHANAGLYEDSDLVGGEPNSVATLSHMQIGVRDLRNRTAEVIAAVESGERVTLTVRGAPVADVVPHGRRARWLSGAHVGRELRERAADPGLRAELDELAGETLDRL